MPLLLLLVGFLLGAMFRFAGACTFTRESRKPMRATVVLVAAVLGLTASVLLGAFETQSGLIGMLVGSALGGSAVEAKLRTSA